MTLMIPFRFTILQFLQIFLTEARTFIILTPKRSVIYFFKIGLIASPETTISPLEECNVLEYNGEEAINLLFFSTESQAKEYLDYLTEQEALKQLEELLTNEKESKD